MGEKSKLKETPEKFQDRNLESLNLQEVYDPLIESLIEKDVSFSTAESCTGGLISKLVTDRPGVSAVYWGGFVAYSNDAKVKLLDVPRETLDKHGAVSPETARAMAQGAKKVSGAEMAVSITGIAGPGGGTRGKPVGLVYLGMKSNELSDPTGKVIELRLKGERKDVRRKASLAAGLLLEEGLKDYR